MPFLWPGSLFLLGAMPILIAFYIGLLRRRRRFAVRYSSLSLVREAIPQGVNWRRHIPFALFLLALASLVVALSRPVSIVSVPTDQTNIILAMDVSGSMCLTDISPSRLLAAENAALGFIRRQEAKTQIGVVAFSGSAELIQAPTKDPEKLRSAIESLAVASTTSIGSAIRKSLGAIATIDPNVWADGLELYASEPAHTPAPVPQGAYAPDIIILLTDGVSNTGPDPLEAAQQAADRGVRVFTIGYGTEEGALNPECPQKSQSSEPNSRTLIVTELDNLSKYGVNDEHWDRELISRPYTGGGASGGSGGSAGFPRGIDEDTLKQIAAMTGGTYYSAESAGELQKVFKDLPSYLLTRHDIVEISVAFAAIGALLTALAVGLSMMWHPM